MPDSDMERLFGAPPMSGPPRVSVNDFPHETVETGGASVPEHVVRASHGGYAELYDLIHTRQLKLSPDGRCLSGLDRICGGHRDVRLAADLPISIHFHFAPGVDVSAEDRATREAVVLRTPDGRRIAFEVEGAQIAFEDSLYRAVPGSPLARRQIVLRGATFGETEVKWAFRVDPE